MTNGVVVLDKNPIVGRRIAGSVILGVLVAIVSLNGLEPTMAEELNWLRHTMTVLYFGFLLIFYGLTFRKYSMQYTTWGLLLVFTWVLFCVFTMIAHILHEEPLSDDLWRLTIIPLVAFSGFPRAANKDANFILALGLVLGFAPYIIISLMWYPLSTFYQGVLNNPNSLALYCTVSATGIFILIRGALRERNYFLLGLLGIAQLVVLVVIILTASRTSLLTFLTLLIVFIRTLFIAKNVKSIIEQIVIIILVAGYCMLPLGLIASNFEDKDLFMKYGERTGDYLLTGRDEIWKDTIEEASIFGHGNQYFFEQFNLVSHNNIIDVLGSQGILAAIAISCFLFFSLICVNSYMIKCFHKDKYSFGPLMVSTCFIVLGMGENTLATVGNGLNIVYFFSIGVAMDYCHGYCSKNIEEENN